ncbi:acylpyruvate hydrolase [Cryobacterium psychrotolerans]|uniref:Acylpyruvate hydrolase n=1 Tax=Cryobacterium psychrotolerans TaxID=386301 RepID=A0A1G9B8Y9_9MICO|nr:fumarylacetoacetate hydrolase family protein [Cryobacterium psychrotolerans]TFD84672.1 FAA hydrolase family protein [Cryobacterium psychrotolerans]SDK35948.1 acylpyruvate hydrolase [Cryobacterium psychrotolerans]
MRLATLEVNGSSTAAVEVNGLFVSLPAADVGALLKQPDWRQVVEAHLADEPAVSVRDADYRAVIPAPSKVLCCGHNYSEHIRELGRELPPFPTLFAKFADTLTGPYAELVLDGESTEIDWEAELAVVVGAEVYKCTPEEASAAIAGYTVANDVSMRDWQRRTLQWLQGKAFDASTPLGPVLVTADECSPESGLAITCTVNGEVVQEGCTSTLVFDAAALISYISTFTVLRPGDVVLTGTPGGVGMARKPPRFLADGDVLVTAIEGIGELRNRVRMPVREPVLN